MPNNDWKKWEIAMKEWLKKIIAWQKANPDKNWLTSMGDAESAEGSNPPTPPPPPPGNG